jgi:hypothetical protein
VMKRWRYSVSCVEALAGAGDIEFEQGGVLRFLDLPAASGPQPTAARMLAAYTHIYV